MKGIAFNAHTCLFILLLNGAKSISLANRRYTLTYHDYKKTWNEALAICEALNGSLMKLDSQERTNVLETYIPTWPTDHVWIGLHYPSTESNDRYGWLDCALPVYTNWYQDEPKHTTTERCSYRNKDHGQWKSHECDATKKFVYQIDGGPCTFIQSNGIPAPSTEYEAIATPEANVDYCLARCLSVMHDNTNCWSANYNGTTCTLYYTSLPFLFTSLDRSDDSINFYTKDCFNSSIDTIDDTTVIVTNGPEPNTNCTIFTNQTTPTTSWTTSSTSTTTSSTTTSTSTTTSSTTTSTSTTTSSTTTSTSSTTSSTTTSTSTKTSSTISSTIATMPSTISSSSTTMSSTTPTLTSTGSTTTTPKTTTLESLSTTSNIITTPRTTVSTTSHNALSSTAMPTTKSSTTTTKSSTASEISVSTVTLTASSTLTESPVTSGSISSLNTTQSNSVTSASLSPSVSTTSKHSNGSTTPNPNAENTTCLCNCTSVTSLLSNLTLPQKLELIRLKLKLDFKALSSSIRKKTSAPDDRTSAKSVGYVAVVFVCLELSIFFVLDFFKFCLNR